MVAFAFDPARAATEGADVKYKRSANDPLIVPLRNTLSVQADRSPKRMLMVSASPPPAQLSKEIIATFADAGVTEAYRIVRGKDGKIAAERL